MESVILTRAWHSGPEDSFHGTINAEGPFTPEKGRYHLYIGLFCPFAHRVNIVMYLKQLARYAEIDTSTVRPYPKGDADGWPGWQFNVKGEPIYQGASEDKLFGSKFMHEIYFKADKDFKGRYSVPVLWDKKLNTIVNNESHELLRFLPSAFSTLLPPHLSELTLYPADLRNTIDTLSDKLQLNLNTGVYKAGFAPDQDEYNKNLIPVFAMVNKLEKVAAHNGGPYLLGKQITEVDIRAYATLIRFDSIYAQHFKCNLGLIRHNYPVLHNWLKNLYWHHSAFHQTTDFRHIKENYTKSHDAINPTLITPLGPWPHIEDGYEQDWSGLKTGSVDMQEVLEYEATM